MQDKSETVKGSGLFLPDYIQSFTEIVKSCGHTAAYCYGIIYFFGRMAGKKCTLSNEDLASLMFVKANTVSEWLTLLEKEKFIVRVKRYGRRIEIKPTFFPDRHDSEDDGEHFGKIPKALRENPEPLLTQVENQKRIVSPKGNTAKPLTEPFAVAIHLLAAKSLPCDPNDKAVSASCRRHLKDAKELIEAVGFEGAKKAIDRFAADCKASGSKFDWWLGPVLKKLPEYQRKGIFGQPKPLKVGQPDRGEPMPDGWSVAEGRHWPKIATFRLWEEKTSAAERAGRPYVRPCEIDPEWSEV